MYFCEDLDLLPWEPSLFLESAFAHQHLLQKAAATLAGTALVTADPLLAHVQPGMVAIVTVADDSLTQLLEVVAVADSTHATVSALRGRAAEAPLPPLAGGNVQVSVLTFRPQIAAVGDELLALLGISSDRSGEPAPATASLAGFRIATVFGTLAVLFRTLAGATNPSSLTLSKRNFYDGLAKAARRAIAGTLDLNGDGVPETPRHTALPTLERL